MPVLLHAVLEDLVEGFGTPFHLWKSVLRGDIPACKTVAWHILLRTLSWLHVCEILVQLQGWMSCGVILALHAIRSVHNG